MFREKDWDGLSPQAECIQHRPNINKQSAGLTCLPPATEHKNVH